MLTVKVEVMNPFQVFKKEKSMEVLMLSENCTFQAQRNAGQKDGDKDFTSLNEEVA